MLLLQARYISLVCHARSNGNDVIALAINIPRQIEARGRKKGERTSAEGEFESGLLFRSRSIILDGKEKSGKNRWYSTRRAILLFFFFFPVEELSTDCNPSIVDIVIIAELSPCNIFLFVTERRRNWCKHSRVCYNFLHTIRDTKGFFVQRVSCNW